MEPNIYITPSLSQNQHMRKWAVLFVLGVLGIVIVWWLVHFLTTAKLTITTNNPNNVITLTKNGDPKFSIQSNGRLSATLGTGTYIASVQGSSIATNQVIKLKAHKTVTLEINPAEASGVEPVTDTSGYNIAADGSRMFFVNGADQRLYQIDSKNNLQKVSDIQFRSIQWADANYGVGEDFTGSLFIISNSSVEPIKQSPPHGSSPIVNFAISNNRQIYVSSDTYVYSGTPEAGFKKIYTAQDPDPVIVAMGTKIAITSGQDDRAGKFMITVLEGPDYKSSHKSAQDGDLEAAAFAWSAGGKYFAVTSNGSSTIYDSTLHKITIIPGQSINKMIWADDDTLFYSLQDQLWAYNITSKKSQLTANTPLGGAISELTVSADKAYLYMVVERSSSNQHFEIKRVGLKGQTVQPAVYQLQDILPKSLGQCSLDLLNFTSPVVLVRVAPGVSPETCRGTATTELQQNGFDLSKLSLQFGTLP